MASFMDTEFNNDSLVLIALTMSNFVLGYVIQPLIILAPIYEIDQRRPVLTLANVFFCFWQIGCAVEPNLNSLIAFRFIAGIGGSRCLTIGGGDLEDIFHAEQRGPAASSILIRTPFEPVIGIAGGFISQRADWRREFRVRLAAGGTITIGIE